MTSSQTHRIYPGYTVAAVSTLALVLTAPGQTMLVSLLNVPLREAFDIEALWLNSAYTVATVLASLPLVWMGRLIDRHGPRKMLVAIAIAFGLACCFMASVAHVAMVVAGFFLLRFLGQGSLALVSSHALAMWFHARLGTIAGIRSVVLFAAWAPLPTLTVALIAAVGWRSTWAVYGAVVAASVSVTAWLFVRDRPEDLGLAMDGNDGTKAPSEEEPGMDLRSAMRTRSYWVLASCAVLPPMIGTAMLFDIEPLLAARGIGAKSAAHAVSAWSATMALMALPSGRLVDRLRPGPVIAAGLVAIAVSCVLLLRASTGWAAIAAMCVYAVGQSLVASAIGTTTARFFGRAHHGAIRSSLGRIGVIATGLGPLVFGLSQHFSGTHSIALVAFAALCLPSLAGALVLLKPPRPA